MAEAANVAVLKPKLDNEHTLTYLKVLSTTIQRGPAEITSDRAKLEKNLSDTISKLVTQHSESKKFAMQNHIGAEVSEGWWSVEASHDHQFEKNSYDAKQIEESKRTAKELAEAMHLKTTYQLKEGEVYVETIAMKCHKFTVQGKQDQVHCAHYPARVATVVGKMTREDVLNSAKFYFLDLESWKPVFMALDMDDVDVGIRRNKLEEKLKVKVHRPSKEYNPIYLKSHEKWALDVKGGHMKNGTNIILYEYQKGDNQLWKYDGTYIRCKKDPDFVIHVAGGNIKNGQHLHIYKINHTDAQKWDFDGSVFRLRKNPKLVIDLPGYNKKRCNNIHLWKENNTDAQKWTHVY